MLEINTLFITYPENLFMYFVYCCYWLAKAYDFERKVFQLAQCEFSVFAVPNPKREWDDSQSHIIKFADSIHC